MTDNNKDFDVESKIANDIKNNFIIIILTAVILFNVMNDEEFNNESNISKSLQFITFL